MAEPYRTCGIAMLNFEPREPLANYDRLISKTPEEMARWLALHPRLPNCPAQTEMCFKESKFESCAKRWLDWLKQEVVSDG